MNKLQTLTAINLNDLVTSFGWQRSRLLTTALHWAFRKPAQTFAEQMLAFDEEVGQSTLATAARQTLQQRFARDVRVHGREFIPVNQPVIFLSNHPGMADTLALFAAINRPDLNIIAIQRPFLETLSHTTQRLFFIDDEPAKRVQAVRQVAAYLKNNGAVLTFPAGKIEPDPDVYVANALGSLNSWADSAAVFMRFAPKAVIVPTLVSGVIWEAATRHFLTHLKQTQYDRERLAAALQLLAMVSQDVRPTTIHVRFAKPITLDEAGSTEASVIHRLVIQRMKMMFQRFDENKIIDEGVSAIYD